MKKSANAIWRTLLVFPLGLFVSMARGQQPGNPPSPPEQSPTSPSGNRVPQETVPTTPERPPLTGAEQFTLRQMGRKRSFVIGGVDVLELGDSNVPLSTTETGLDSSTTFTGHFGFGRIGGKSQFLTEYRGGGFVYAQQPALDSSFHNLGVEQRVAGRRWTLLLADQFSYLPQSSFGFYGFGATQGNLNTNISTLNPLFLTAQDILTLRASRYSNTGVGELSRHLGRKSSFSASASYNLLRSPGVGFVDNDGAVFLGTYNYRPTGRTTLALSYGYSRFRYPGQRQVISDHLVRAGYERMITRRVSLQLSAGPEVYMFSGTGSANSRQLSWGQQSVLLYSMRRTNLSFFYSTYLSGGSGVLQGAQTHDVRARLARRWSPMWTSSFDFGFARSSALSQTLPQGADKDTAYRAWYGNALVTRTLGRRAQLLLTYTVQVQGSNSALCSVAICSQVPAHHVFGLGFSWHLEPAGSQVDSNSNLGIW